MKKNLLLLFFLFFSVGSTWAQMTIDGEMRFGNEWINYEQSYLKIKITDDGWYQLTAAQLRSAGMPTNTVPLSAVNLTHLGTSQAIVRSTAGIPSEEDYIAFYGVRNRGELDRQLFGNPDEDMLNPYYSMFSDTAVYYLSWENTSAVSPDFSVLPNDLNNLPEKEAWYWHTERKVFGKAGYSKTNESQNLLKLSAFDYGEGFASQADSIHVIDFNPTPVDVAEEARMYVQLFSNRLNNQLSLLVNGKEYIRENIPGNVQFLKKEWTIPIRELSDGSTLVVRDLRSREGQYAIAFAELTYPRGFDAQGASYLTIDLDAGPRRYYEWTNFNTEGGEVWVYDLDNQSRLSAQVDGNIVRFAIPARAKNSRLILVNENLNFSQVAGISAPRWEDLRNSQADFLIITHKALLSDGNNVNKVAEYAQYRSSQQGGGYNTQIVTVDQLYDQFAYGIHNHPLSIQNFSQYAAQNWPRLKYVLLLGHGYNYAYNRAGSDNFQQSDFVPSYGDPASDNLLLAPKGSSIPSFAVGRIAANTPEEVTLYLNKVKQYDEALRNATSLEERLWRKRVLHIVGGSNAGQQREYKGHLDQMADRIANNGFGAFMKTVSKDNDEVVQQSTSTQVIEAVNQGVAIKAFLGHGGVTNTDFGLDNPLLFDNEGHYPLIFSLGCLTGNLFDQQRSLSESFILTPNKGGIGYVASAGYAYASSLKELAGEFYDLVGGDLYDAGIGEIIQAMRRKFDNSGNLGIASLVEQLSFHGDPAIKMNLYKGPDYIVDAASVQISPSSITASQDSFSLAFDVLNLGFNQADTFAIQFQRTFPNGEKKIRKDTVVVGIGKSHFNIRFKLGDEEVEGEHRIEILLDADNAIRELPASIGENNNDLVDNNGQKGISFFVQQNAILMVSPPAFAIVNETQPQLVSSSNTLETKERPYVFELDTTPYFNSSLKKIHQLKARGGVLSWQPDINWTQGQVYHWRIREENPIEERWENRSFIYLPDSLDGWNQSQYYQLATDSLMNLEKVENKRNFEYGVGFQSVTGTAMSHSEEINNDASKFTYGGEGRKYWGARWWGSADSHIFVGVFDPKTAAFWRNTKDGRFGSLGRDNHEGFVFKIDNPDSRNAITRLINDSIPDGFYVLVLTSQRFASSLKVEEWGLDSLSFGTNIFSTLEAQGARLIRQMEQTGSLPYAFAFIKNQAPLGEALASDINELVTVNFDVPFLRRNACITSPLIGPAQDWHSLDWQAPITLGQNDQLNLTLLKWTADRSSSDTVQVFYEGGQYDLSSIDPASYPFLQLKYCARDDDDRSFTELAYWRVFFEGMPDLVLTTGEDFSFQGDTIQQGQELQLTASLMAFNAGVQDSIDLRFSIRSADNQTTEILKKLAPQEEGSSQPVRLNFNTEEIGGQHELVVEANPARTILEERYTNNLGVLPFFIKGDIENPILDVTFDGRHIFNGELVSARPLINISLTDENEFLKIQDTTSFQIWLDAPDGSSKAYYFDDPQVRFFAANDDKKNRARVEFEPMLELDGAYQLRIRASDATGNVAGASAYEVNFQVITESQLSNILPYPNPFTTSCRFVYTLTGDREPADFKIQIMTVSGRIVREITQVEFGQMRVGTHTSDFVWDGTDEYGDQLANGVYIYRVIAKDMEGEELKHFERTGVDAYFKKDLGKIVILR